MAQRTGAVLLAVLLLSGAAVHAEVVEEMRARREAVFEFAAPPKVTRNGDRVEIAFETKGFCDVTVAIEDGGGRILRHLASGVLGATAPAPFTKGSKAQRLVWDGKDDQDAYVDDKHNCAVRVSLGLKPVFERSLLHSPYRRFGRNQPVIAPAPEGVYIYEGDIADSIRLFGHDGTYLRTVYPFPNAKLEQVKGLRWHDAPQDGARLPQKDGYHQATLFTAGYNAGFDKSTGFGVNRFLTLKHFDGNPSYPAAYAMAVRGERIALAGVFLNRMATDGSSGGLDLNGPKTSLAAQNRHYCEGAKPIEAFPRSAALSPDGKWLYLTAYTWDEGGSTAGQAQRWIHGVVRTPVDGEGESKVFVGSDKWDAKDAGDAPDKLNAPMSVVCDGQGRVFVADYGNNRIQVFDANAKLLESIPFHRPVRVDVNHRNGELYVFSWAMLCDATDAKQESFDATLTRLDGGSGHKKLAEFKLPFAGYNPSTKRAYAPACGLRHNVTLDAYAEPPALWVVPGAPSPQQGWKDAGLRLYALEKDKLALKKDFGELARKATVLDNPSETSRQRLAANPKSGKLYVMHGMGLATGDHVLEIDPETGKEQWVALPFGCEELCFDAQGLAYLRTGFCVARYDARTWREVPWDYGEELDGVHHCGGKAGSLMSGLVTPGSRASPWYHGGGFGVSPKGTLVVQCFNGGVATNGKLARPDEKHVDSQAGKRYTPQIYPGRERWGEIHIFDRYGKVVFEDATPGITMTDGVAIDRDENIYLLTNPTRTPGGKQILNPKSETLMKLRPGKAKVYTLGDGVPVPLKKEQAPDGPADMAGFYQGTSWVKGAEWLYGGVGYSGGRCTCWNSRFALDYYARSIAPEPSHFSVAVLDTAGNVIVRIGRPGNVEDGQPLVADSGLPATRSIGGDETALLHACYVAVDTDRRIFIDDAGNRRIASVMVDYHSNSKVSLKDVPDQAKE